MRESIFANSVNDGGILICGANGSGKTTLGCALADVLGYRHMDIEAYYFRESENPYAAPRTREEVCELLLKDMEQYKNFVFSAVNGDMGERINEKYRLAVFLSVPLDVRLERIRNRAYARFGDRVRPGGDLYEQEEKFFAFVAQRSVDHVERWIRTLSCPVLFLDGSVSVKENVKNVQAHL